MLLTFLSAILFYLSFPNYISMDGFWPCIWFFAVPLLLALHGQPWKKRIGYGLWWGICAYGLMAQGLVAISAAGFLAFVSAMALQAVIFAFLFLPVKHPWAAVLFAAAGWAASEWARNNVLGGFSFYISHAHAFCPLMLKLYGLTGCLGMSFIIFLVNSLIYIAFINGKQRAHVIIVAAIIFTGVVLAGLVKEKAAQGRPLRVSVVQADISPWEKGDPSLFDQMVLLHLHLTDKSFSQAHPDLVIWPETAFPDDLLQSMTWRGIIFGEARHIHADLLAGMAPIIDAKEYNSAVLINTSGQVGGLYHKQALVPFAENTPLEAWGIRWGRGYHFRAGNKPGLMRTSRGVLFGVVICSESAHPSQVRQLRQAGAKFIVEISNDGWFTDKASYMLHAQAAVMRAVENRLWVVRAANTGFSFAVDPEGIIHSDGNLKLGQKGFGIFDIMVRDSSF